MPTAAWGRCATWTSSRGWAQPTASRRWCATTPAPSCTGWTVETGSSQLQDLDPATLDAASVFAAALDEDPLAVSVVEHVAALLARVVATFASIYDPERVIIAGAVAASCGPLLELVRRDLDRYVDPPGIEVLASELGRDIVTIGAVKRALDHVREHALEIAPAALR